MRSCMFNCLKYTFGFWGAIALIGLLIVGITAAVVGTGGGAAAAIALALETAVGAAGLATAGVGAMGMGGSLVGCLAGCWYVTP